jgi:hypothetical protein
MTYPIGITVTVDFGTSPVFGYPFIFDDPKNGILNKSALGATTDRADIVDVSDNTLSINMSGGYNLLQDQFQTNQGTVRIYDPNGDWNPQNTSSPYYGKLTPNRKIRISTTYPNTADGTERWLFSGYISAYNYSFPTAMNFGYVDLQCTDAFRLFNLANIQSVPAGISGQTTGQRINAILDILSFPTSMREIDTGDNFCQADPGTNRTALAAMKNVEFTEQGALFLDPAGDVIFMSRKNVAKTDNAAPITYFSNDGTGIKYASIKFAHDDKLIVNQTKLTNVGGTTQVYEDAASEAKYFPHTVTQTDLVGLTDAQTYSMGKVYVNTRKDTSIRIDQISLDLTTPNYADGILAALTLNYFDTVRIKNAQSNGSTVEKILQIMGSNYKITPNAFDISFVTSEPIVDGFLFDSATYGILDTDQLV